MEYKKALDLITACIENDILQTQDNKVFVYREASTNNKEGWHLDSKDYLAEELMNDKNGQDALISALREKGVNFEEYYLNNN